MDQAHSEGKQPERLYDTKGVPIYPGDLIRSYHFTGARNKRFYLYHVVTKGVGGLYGVPTEWLAMNESERRSSGGRFRIDQESLDSNESTVIAGFGPRPCLDYTDRPKRKSPKPDAVVSEANS